ncbi:hypothetical protein SPRG_15387 [Saprolegnia parasitica CBS 223.65]|uniref:EamA domain-containing protein n=1 Tax=Saprolegnia parasitica (strain CBS 223.65) TaxID=695850 RepID=A0A067BUE6_SAPPC|nr:hypothetical protein SPRG_15387 [Saprolegnia parasitica CBS 223.65]KDO18207.1 hypothetical protein SPRG_15387 [Saprolegnia parasitica CBS 223.65]|eukprot:XP_012211087.1 hypothetical protein SPRG_15387 [Saprolegnia parasitica CBS 223.65]
MPTSAVVELVHPETDAEPLLLATDGVHHDSKPLRVLRHLAKRRHAISESYGKFFGFGMIIGGNIALSLMSVLIKFSSRFLYADEIVFWRSSTALVMNVAVQLYLKIPLLAVEPRLIKLLCIRVAIGYTAMTMSFYAYSKMVLSEASVIIFTAPIITCVLSVCLLGEKIDVVGGLCVLVSFAGVICVARPAFVFGVHAASSEAPPLAMLCAILTAVCVGLINILIRMLQSMNTWTLGLYVPQTTDEAGIVLAIGFFGCIGQLMITKGLQIEKAGIASVLQYLNLLCVMLWDVTLLGEALHMWSILGAAIICLSASVIAYRKANA